MTNRFLTPLTLSALLLAGIAGEASAAAQRTFVASTGNDANPCSLASPCRGFAAAMAQTLGGGEVIVLDSAGYGAVTISQSVSIIAPPGVYAGISVISGTGITVNAAGAKVTLRGLTINALGGTTGVSVAAVGTLYIDRLTISGFSTGLSANVSAASTINILQSAFRDNGTGATFSSSAGTLAVSIEGSVLERNTANGASFTNNTAGAIVGSLIAGGGVGVNANAASGTSKVEIRDSNINDNTSAGVNAGPAAGTNTVSVVSSVVSGNSVGLQVAGGTNEVYSSDSTITRNATGLSAPTGTLRSGTDNRLVNNTTNGAFTTSTGKL
jgi:hypothetical protein